MADTGKSWHPSYLADTPHGLVGLAWLVALVEPEVRQRQRLSRIGCPRRNLLARALAERRALTGVDQRLGRHQRLQYRLLRQRFESRVYTLSRGTYHPRVGRAKGPMRSRCPDQGP